MDRGKKSRKSGLTTPTQTGTQSANTPIEAADQQNGGASGFKKHFSFLDYALVSVFFILFCYIQKFVALHWFGVDNVEQSLEGLSLTFFFDTMWKGFLVVAFLAWLHDYFYPDEAEEEDTA